MSDSQQQIIELLTSIRDSHQDESAFRRRILDKTLSLQRRCARQIRVALIFLGVIATAIMILLIVGVLHSSPTQHG